MHIIGILVALIGGAAFWYFRYKQSREMIDDAVDVVGRAKGAYKRRQFRNKAEASVLASIDDPVQAVSVLLVGLAEAAAPMTREIETEIESMLSDITGASDSAEHVAFAKWACREVPDLDQAIRRLAPLWNKSLDMREKKDLVDMAQDVSALSGETVIAQQNAVKRLRRELNLPSPSDSF